MDASTSGVKSVKIEDFDWDTEDELEIENFAVPSRSTLAVPGGVAAIVSEEASSSAGSSNSKLFDRFLGMGFSEKIVAKAIQDHGKGTENPGEENEEDIANSILETLLTYSALEKSLEEEEKQIEPDSFSSEYEENFLNEFSDFDSSDSEAFTNCTSDEEDKLITLVKLGYTEQEASLALDRCGSDPSLADLIDFLAAAQAAKAADGEYPLEEKPRLNGDYSKLKKRKMNSLWRERKFMKSERGIPSEDDETVSVPNPMVGFGLPNEIPRDIRIISNDARGPPYFYYENVALAPKGVWATISRFLYDIAPEFVDSKFFCAAARKRGYVHNLPITNRFPLLPQPPQTIHEALPLTKRWWPKWDARTKLNCLQTCVGTAKLTNRVRKALEAFSDGVEPPLSVQKYVLGECKKWNLVWVGKNKAAPLEPDEVEMLLGFPRNHTRGGGISRTDRYKSLGNSFQVDTVAFHLSVLKDLFPGGINLLSLFSGIGGAEVALHRLGVPLKNVVSVEKSEVNRDIVRSWWEQTNQRGNLYDLDDVQKLTTERLGYYMDSFGGFDLVVGGSPCNNLAGSNRHHRDGLEGTESSLFFEYQRILDFVMSRRQ